MLNVCRVRREGRKSVVGERISAIMVMNDWAPAKENAMLRTAEES